MFAWHARRPGASEKGKEQDDGLLKQRAKTPRPKEKACTERSRRIDPQLVAKARELRDRYLEGVNENPMALIGSGKYGVSRALMAPAMTTPKTTIHIEAQCLRHLPPAA